MAESSARSSWRFLRAVLPPLALAALVVLALREPLTEGRARVMHAAGCQVATNYTMGETGRLGVPCGRPVAVDDVHLVLDKIAVIRIQKVLANGAQVVAAYGDRKQSQAVLAQTSYLSANDRRLHFGLGAESKASLEIRWPNGGTEKIPEVDADLPVRLAEIDPHVRPAVVRLDVPQPGEERVRQDDPADDFRMEQGGVNADHPAEAVADDDRRFQAERGVQFAEVGRHVGGRVAGRRPVARHDDLTSTSLERVEDAEHLALRLAAAREKLNVVQQQHVDSLIALLE